MASTSANLNFRPMLARSESLTMEELGKLPLHEGFIVSPKVDGIRCNVHKEHGALTRSMKPIANAHIRKVLSIEPFVGLDGELTAGDYATRFWATSSAVMSHSGEPDFTFYVFDYFQAPHISYKNRLNDLQGLVEDLNELGWPFIKMLPFHQVTSVDEILKLEEHYLAMGLEGLIVRNPHSPYKHNRSTFREMGMLKLKRFADAEAEVIGYEPLYTNQNAAFLDERGYTRRSSHAENQVAQDMLGKFIVRGINGPWVGVEFSVGSGLDDSLRSQLWVERDTLTKRVIKFKYQIHGSEAKPRVPIFLGFRDPSDL